MKKIFILIIPIFLISFVKGISQTTQDSTIIVTNNELKGLVLDMDNQTALAYANIYVLHKNKGVISNEKGYFSLNIKGLDDEDTLRFQYIGYKTKKITIGQLDTASIIYLQEDIINLSETLIFGSAPDAKFIIKKVIEFKDSK